MSPCRQWGAYFSALLLSLNSFYTKIHIEVGLSEGMLIYSFIKWTVRTNGP